LISIIVLGAQARIIRFKNSCPFSIDVERTPGGVVCSNLARGATCTWTVPAGGWSGNFHRRNKEGGNLGFPSATLAEFALGSTLTSSQWNYDWFDISIIPPGCPGTIRSYDGCWCNGGTDGYDVGMTIVPAKCRDKTRTCLGRYCAGAYNFPKDDTKTTACVSLGDWDVEFCPAGSLVDLGSTQQSQVPPCKRGKAIASDVQSLPDTQSSPSGFSASIVAVIVVGSLVVLFFIISTVYSVSTLIKKKVELV